MMQMQTNQIVKTLMLDDATAAKFTPVYEKYLGHLASQQESSQNYINKFHLHNLYTFNH